VGIHPSLPLFGRWDALIVLRARLHPYILDPEGEAFGNHALGHWGGVMIETPSIEPGGCKIAIRARLRFLRRSESQGRRPFVLHVNAQHFVAVFVRSCDAQTTANRSGEKCWMLSSVAYVALDPRSGQNESYSARQWPESWGVTPHCACFP